jgi:hypothetical protein
VRISWQLKNHLRYWHEHPRQALVGSYHRIEMRTHNRLLDLRGRLAGMCMADTWHKDPRWGWGYSPGYSHWRCLRRRGHAGPHRFINYVWVSGEGRAEYLSEFAPVDHRMVRQVDGASKPKWVRHHAISRRSRARLMYESQQKAREKRAAERLKEAAREAAGSARRLEEAFNRSSFPEGHVPDVTGERVQE